MWKALLKAARYARKAHAGQKRAHGTPYFEHPCAVARGLWESGRREPALLMAAYLHDTIEDCGETAAALTREFGPETARLVTAVTKAPTEGYESYYGRIKAAGELAMALKLTDRRENGKDLRHLPEGHPLRTQYPGKLAAMLAAFGA